MKSRARALLSGAGVLFGTFLLFATWLLGTAWYRVPHYDVSPSTELAAPILTPDEYRALIQTHSRPFVYEIGNASGAVLIYGAEHTRNPQDAQIADIATRWRVFAPTVALVESDLGMMFPAFMDPVETFGEVARQT